MSGRRPRASASARLSSTRHAALVDALDGTDGLDADWARLSAGSVAATKMSGYLAEHDRLIAEAAKQGRLAKYDAAIALIDKASAQLAAAHGRAERADRRRSTSPSSTSGSPGTVPTTWP